MVDVEQRALRALEQNRHIFVERSLDDRVRIGHMVGQLAAVVEIAQIDLVQRQRRLIIDRRQQLVLGFKHLAQPAQQRFFVQQIAQPDTDARHLVGVGRADSAPGGADLVIAAQHFFILILQHMVGHDRHGRAR